MTDGFIVTFKWSGESRTGPVTEPAFVAGSTAATANRASYFAASGSPFVAPGAVERGRMMDLIPCVFPSKEEAQAVVSEFKRSVQIGEGKASEIEVVAVRRVYAHVVAGVERVS